MPELDKIISDNREYIAALFNEWYPYIYRAVLRYYGNSMDKPEYKTAEIFEKTLHSLASHNPSSKNTDSAFRKLILSEIVKDIKTSSANYHIASTYSPEQSKPQTYSLFETYELADVSILSMEHILQALSSLSPPKRLIFNLHELDELSISEISEVLETSEQTVRMNLEKARYEFQKLIEKQISTTTPTNH